MESQVRRGGIIGMLSGLAASDLSASFPGLHERGPVIHTPTASLVVGHDEASAVLKDAGHYSSEFRSPVRPPDAATEQGRSMLSSDPPDHERLRGVVAKAFTPRSVAALEPRVREIAEEFLTPVRTGEPYDVIEQLAYPIPVIVIAELLGVPAEDREHFKRWSDDLVAFNEPGRATGDSQSVEELRDYFQHVIEQRRREPRDDLVSRLVEANEGGILTSEELVSQCVLLLVAGNETTTHLIGNAVNTLGRRPDQWQRLLDEPGLAGNAVEEVLRFDGVVVMTVRVARGGPELAGRTLADGHMVAVMVSAANHDPRKFENPGVFDVTRPNANQNLGFGGGIHYCLGAALARQETRVALETLAKVSPNWRLADPDAPVEFTTFLRGPKRLEILAS